jgi:hypothetical protein
VYLQPSWVGDQTRKSYKDFVGQLDQLVDSDVRWLPYSEAEVQRRAPEGLSSLCFRDREYWLTKKPLLYDIYVEEYQVHRVLRQFNLYQASPLPVTHSVPDNVHRSVII